MTPAEMRVVADALDSPPSRVFDLHGMVTTTEANAKGHWRGKASRAKHQRGTAALMARVKLGARCPVPRLVRITRISPRVLDSDNLASALKHLRDGIADVVCGGDDSDARGCVWLVAQERGPVGVRVEVWL